MNKQATWALLAVATLTVPMVTQGVTLQIDGSGVLTGASEVAVGGALYDVRFLDGTCISLFTGCDDSTDFAFASAADALIAAQALLDQVLTDTPLGQFDSVVALTSGCTNSDLGACGLITPYAAANGFVDVVDVENFFVEDADRVAQFPSEPSFDTTSNPAFTYAVWSLASLPEPGSFGLLVCGILGLGLTRRRKRVHTRLR